MNVQAEDKGTAKKASITIDKGRLSDEEIQRMVREAEEASESDKKAKERVEAKNQLENYVYQIRNFIEDDEKIGDKLTADEKSTVQDAVKEKLEWIEQNLTAEKEEYDAQYKELEKAVQPVMAKFYQAGGSGPEGASGSEEMPDHDEL